MSACLHTSNSSNCSIIKEQLLLQAFPQEATSSLSYLSDSGVLRVLHVCSMTLPQEVSTVKRELREKQHETSQKNKYIVTLNLGGLTNGGLSPKFSEKIGQHPSGKIGPFRA